MFGIDDAILAAVAAAVAEALAKRGLDLLKRDPERLAFKVALAETLSQFGTEHQEWVHSYFDSGFLKREGATVLARAVMRDGPTPVELARAYTDQFFHGAEGNPERVKDATPIAADFLLQFDLALRRQRAFRDHFDSKAMDKSALYLYELLELFRADWAKERREWVARSFDMLIDANEIYRAAALTLAKGEEVTPFQEASARSAERKAHNNLRACEYSGYQRLKAAFSNLVTEPYALLNDDCVAKRSTSASLKKCLAGYDEMEKLIGSADPV